MKNNLFKSVSLTLVLSTLASCSESWLDPEPLSFMSLILHFSTVEGLEGALTRCRSDMLYYFLGSNGTAVSTELIFSDVAVSAITDLSGSQNFASDITQHLTIFLLEPTCPMHFGLVEYPEAVLPMQSYHVFPN